MSDKISLCICNIFCVDPPFAPRDLKVVDYNVDYVALSWTAPEHDGGSSILAYSIEKRDSLMNMWSQAAKVDKDTFSAKVSGLFEGQSYLFRVAAENQCGRGSYAETLKPVTAKLPFGLVMFIFCYIDSLSIIIVIIHDEQKSWREQLTSQGKTKC